MPSSSRIRTAPCMTGRSESLPITIPTIGLAIDFSSFSIHYFVYHKNSLHVMSSRVAIVTLSFYVILSGDCHPERLFHPGVYVTPSSDCHPEHLCHPERLCHPGVYVILAFMSS